MSRKKPALRLVTQRSRNNAKRRLVPALPSMDARRALADSAQYGLYSKHKHNPGAYRLAPYAGLDTERTYCDAHASFGKESLHRIRPLLIRGIMLGLWSEQYSGDVPSLLWTVDDSGWIFEHRVTNVGQVQYHGYPVLAGDAFARQVLARVRDVFGMDGQYPMDKTRIFMLRLMRRRGFIDECSKQFFILCGLASGQ